MNSEVKDLKVRICSHAWEKIAGWRDATKLECSGMFVVRRNGPVFTIYDAFLPIQDCTSGHTQIRKVRGEVDGVSDIMMKCHKRKIPLDHLRGWWHTHATFNCFWSGEDHETAERMGAKAGRYFISIVTNHKNEYLCRLDIFDPFQITVSDIELEFIGGHKLYRTNWEYQVKQKVKEKTYEHVWSNNQSFQGYQDWDTYEWERRYDYSHYQEKGNTSKIEPEKIVEETKPEQLQIPIVHPLQLEYKKPKWYLDWLERKNKLYTKQEIKEERKEDENKGIFVNHGGRTMTMKEYLEEIKHGSDIGD